MKQDFTRTVCVYVSSSLCMILMYIGHKHAYRLHKPVSDWLETLPTEYPDRIYIREIPVGHN